MCSTNLWCDLSENIVCSRVKNNPVLLVLYIHIFKQAEQFENKTTPTTNGASCQLLCLTAVGSEVVFHYWQTRKICFSVNYIPVIDSEANTLIRFVCLILNALNIRELRLWNTAQFIQLYSLYRFLFFSTGTVHTYLIHL